VDLVEQDAKYVQKARKLLEKTKGMGTFETVGLQEYTPG
jgi:hypothetical protein